MWQCQGEGLVRLLPHHGEGTFAPPHVNFGHKGFFVTSRNNWWCHYLNSWHSRQLWSITACLCRSFTTYLSSHQKWLGNSDQKMDFRDQESQQPWRKEELCRCCQTSLAKQSKLKVHLLAYSWFSTIQYYTTDQEIAQLLWTWMSWHASTELFARLACVGLNSPNSRSASKLFPLLSSTLHAVTHEPSQMQNQWSNNVTCCFPHRDCPPKNNNSISRVSKPSKNLTGSFPNLNRVFIMVTMKAKVP